MENVKKFYDALASSETLKEKAAKLNEKYTESEKMDEEAVTADIIAFAASEGYSFTAEELADYTKTAGKPAPQELSQDEWDAVAGGSNSCVDCFGTCFCIVGGGGTHQDPHWVCACVVGGGGSKCSRGNLLICIGFGYLMNPWCYKSKIGRNITWKT